MPSNRNKAIFLDRDGVINEERGEYTWLLEDFRINPGVVDALIKWQADGFLLIVISNQGGIAKGLYAKSDTDFLHHQLTRYMHLAGVTITEVYYCPHHPNHGRCICRKPDSQLLEKAIARYSIDVSASWFIGDSERDQVAGEKVGVKCLKITPNTSLLDVVSVIH